MTEQTERLTLEQVAGVDAFDLLDFNFDEIPDAPELRNLPTCEVVGEMSVTLGTYEADVYVNKEKTGEKENKPKISVSFTVGNFQSYDENSLLENEELPAEGDRSIFQFRNKQGIQRFSQLAGPLAAHTGKKQLKDILEVCGEEGYTIPVMLEVKRDIRKNRESGELYALQTLKQITVLSE